MKRKINKISRVFGVILACFLLTQNVLMAQPASQDKMQVKVDKLRSKTIPIGKVSKGAESFQVNGVNIPTYQSMNVSYLLLSDLRQAGANVVWSSGSGKSTIYDLKQPISENPKFDTLKDGTTAYLGRDKVYINYQEIPAIFADGKALIPAKWMALLSQGGTNNPFEITKKGEQVDADGNTVNLDMKGINLWFDGKNYIEENYNFIQLKPNQDAYYQDGQYRFKPNYSYVGFVITEIDGMVNQNANLHKAWLKNSTYFTIPAPPPPVVKPSTEPSKLFPDTRVKGVMNYAAGGFKKGQTVSVNHASSRKAYHLIGSNGKLVTVPWGSVTIQKAPVSKEQATTAQIEQYINSKDMGSSTNYLIWTDVYRQRTYVFKGSKNNWKLIKNMLTSTGKDTTLTPVGTYKLGARVPAFGMNKGYRAKNAYGFIGTTYLYHSEIYNVSGTHLLSGWGKLGNKTSNGCIRLSTEDSVWLYKTMPSGTTVFIN